MTLGLTHPLNRNEYRQYFLRDKCSRCLGLTTLPPSCADCLEVWESEPLGALRTCTEITLPFTLTLVGYVGGLCLKHFGSKSQRFEVKDSEHGTKERSCRTNLYIFVLGGKKSVRIVIDTGAPIPRCELDALCRTETRLTVIDYQSLLKLI